MPTPAEAVGVKESRIAAHLKAHRIRRIDAAGVLGILRRKPIAVSPGTIAAATAHIGALAARLKLVNQQLKQAHRRLDELCDALGGDSGAEETAPEQPNAPSDVTILRSLPGVGRINLATLLCEAAHLLRERNYPGLRSLCGAAPVTRRSGKRKVVIMREACQEACHVRLRAALYHWARVAIQRDPNSRTRYAELRKRGHSHARTLRTVGDRLLAVACAMLTARTLFDGDDARAGALQGEAAA